AAARWPRPVARSGGGDLDAPRRLRGAGAPRRGWQLGGEPADNTGVCPPRRALVPGQHAVSEAARPAGPLCDEALSAAMGDFDVRRHPGLDPDDRPLARGGLAGPSGPRLPNRCRQGPLCDLLHHVLDAQDRRTGRCHVRPRRCGTLRRLAAVPGQCRARAHILVLAGRRLHHSHLHLHAGFAVRQVRGLGWAGARRPAPVVERRRASPVAADPVWGDRVRRARADRPCGAVLEPAAHRRLSIGHSLRRRDGGSRVWPRVEAPRYLRNSRGLQAATGNRRRPRDDSVRAVSWSFRTASPFSAMIRRSPCCTARLRSTTATPLAMLRWIGSTGTSWAWASSPLTWAATSATASAAFAALVHAWSRSSRSR